MSISQKNLIMAVVLVIVAAFLKLFTYPQSINPIVAIALFSGAVISDRKLAFAMPLMAMLLSDILLEISHKDAGFYGIGQFANYASLALVTVLGFAIKKTNVVSVAGMSVGATLLFFFLSNSAVFMFSSYYEKSLAGYTLCMNAGIPFMLKRIPVDLLFSALLFTGYYFLVSRKTVSYAKA